MALASIKFFGAGLDIVTTVMSVVLTIQLKAWEFRRIVGLGVVRVRQSACIEVSIFGLVFQVTSERGIDPPGVSLYFPICLGVLGFLERVTIVKYLNNPRKNFPVKYPSFSETSSLGVT